MPNYERIYIPGGTYFFTVVTYQRLSFLTHNDARAILRSSWQNVRRKYPFFLIALCLLPDHLHCMWRLPENDADYSIRWQKIKDGFSRNVDKSIIPETNTSESRKLKRETNVWQRRFWEHTIRDQQDYNKHFDYIHYNPVKHGYVQKAIDWPWSTFHRYVSLGIYDPDWGDISLNDEFILSSVGE